MASWILASQLQRVFEEHEEVALQLCSTLASLRQVTDEREVLRHQLLQVERSAKANPLPQEAVPVPEALQCGAAAWPMDAQKQGKTVATGMQGIPHLRTQMAAPVAVLYMSGSPSPWVQAIQQPLAMPLPLPFPFHVPFPMGFPYSIPLPPSVVMEAEATAAATATAAVAACIPQMPLLRIYPPGLWVAVGDQEEMAHLCDQRCYCQWEYPETIQGECPLGKRINHSQEEGPMCPQGITSLGDIRGQNQKECTVMLQEKYSLGNSKSHSQEE